MDHPSKPRSVNLERLQQLSESQLQDRIVKAPIKSQKKKEQIEAKLKALQLELSEYQKYRQDDMTACKRLLEERKTKKEALPSGGTGVAKRVA